jgi:hypothetical protein
MSLRTLYLQTSSSVDGRAGLAGRQLYDALRLRSEDSLLAHRILPTPIAGAANAGQSRESLSVECLREFAPNLIYIEGGLFADDLGAWKIDWPVVEDMVDRGGVLILADCGTRELSRHRQRYEYAASFLRARAQFTINGVVYGADRLHSWQDPTQILCRTGQMVISDWLRPVYDGVDEILVSQPARLADWQEILVSGNADTTESHEPKGSRKLQQTGPCILGSTARCGFGYVVFIAGEVSADLWVERCPSNARWLANLAEYLQRDAERNHSQARSQICSPFALFLSHRSVNKQFILRVAGAMEENGIGVRLNTDRTMFGNSLVKETHRSLETMTHFVLFWSRACIGAPWVERELAATVDLVVERRIPLVVVRLDFTPLPNVMSDAFRIEAIGFSPQEIARSLADAVQRMARHAPR